MFISTELSREKLLKGLLLSVYTFLLTNSAPPVFVSLQH